MVLEFARVYKLVSSNGLVYYGSTTQKYLCNRLTKHKSDAVSRETPCTSSFLFADGAEVVITLVENVENCKDKYELQARERWHIENNECVNKQVPGRTKKEWSEEHKEELAEYNKIWREKNKEELAEYYKEWREKNKERLAKYHKKWEEDNKAKTSQQRSQKLTCECGAVVSKRNISAHCKTDKHINKMLELNNNGNVQAAIQQEALATTESAE